MNSAFRSLAACLFASVFFAQDASAQCYHPDLGKAQIQCQVRAIDDELQGRVVCVRRALFPRNRVYQTILPSAERRKELLVKRGALQFSLSRRESMLKGLIIGFQIGLMSDPALRDLYQHHPAQHPVIDPVLTTIRPTVDGK